MLVLSGDLGGTKTLLQIAKFEQGQHQIISQQRYISAEFDNLLPILEKFLRENQQKISEEISAACFAIAGPIDGQSAHVTNLNWSINALQIIDKLKINKVKLVNDFFALASAIDLLADDDLLVLAKGEQLGQGNRVILGAGTGLGTAFQIWDGSNYRVMSTEAGHTSFAPGNVIQTELLQYLNARGDINTYTPVNYENLLSGSGIVSIYHFLLEKNKLSNPLRTQMENRDPASVISESALNYQDPLALQALDIFVQIYGRQAANLALTGLSFGGVYIAGGVAIKIKDKLLDGEFIKAFENNKMMHQLLKKMPVRVILNPDAGLIGAAFIASQL